MANEYKLSYTAAEINDKLGQVIELARDFDLLMGIPYRIPLFLL